MSFHYVTENPTQELCETPNQISMDLQLSKMKEFFVVVDIVQALRKKQLYTILQNILKHWLWNYTYFKLF